MGISRIAMTACLVLLVAGLVVSPAWGAPLRQGEPTPLQYGQTVEGELSAERPSALYMFDAALGDVVTIGMQVTGGAIDPFLVLTDESSTLLATDDDSGGDEDARLTFVIPAPGRYLVQATHNGGIVPQAGGTFVLELGATVDGVEVTPRALPSPTPELAPPDLAPESATADLSTTATPLDLPLAEAPTEPTEPPAPTAEEGVTRLVALNSGDSMRDSLDRQTAFRLYWFEGHAEGDISVTPEATSSDFAPLLVLYDSAFAEVQRGPLASGMARTLPADGLYFLAVSLPDARSAGGDYGFTFSQTGLFALGRDASSIERNEPQQGTIDAAVPVAAYRFEGAAQEVITLEMARTGGDLNSYLYLLDADGNLLWSDNDSGGQNGDARLEHTLPADGHYVVVATRVGREAGTTSGSYVLTLSSDRTPTDPVESQAPALPAEYADLPQIAPGETVEGEITPAKYRDLYIFQGVRGEMIRVEMNSLNADEPDGLDPFVILLNAARIPLAEDDDIVDGVERDARLEFTLPQDAYYAIVATRFEQENGTSVGPYALTLSRVMEAETVTAEGTVPAEEPTLLDRLPATPLSANAPAQSVFEAAAALYAFESETGALIDLAVTGDEGVDPVLILADAGLREVASSGAGALTGISLPRSGPYLVLLAPRFGPVASPGAGYILALTQVAPGTAPDTEAPGVSLTGEDAVLSYGETVSGVIDDEIVSQFYTFTGSADDPVRITMRASGDSDLDCYLELRDADGNVVEANDDIDPGIIRDARINLKLPASGEYTIIASRYVGPDAPLTSGAFTLTLEMGAGEDISSAGSDQVQAMTPINYGDSVVGEINDERYLLFYLFEGAENDVVSVAANNLSGNLDSVLFLYQSTSGGWVEVAHNDDSPLGGTYEALLREVKLPATGSYLIAVTRYGMASEHTAGTFTLTLTRH